MNGSKTAIALLMVAMLPVSGCLGIFGDEEAGETTNTSSISQSVDGETAQDIESRSAGQFQNFTIPGQEEIEDKVLWFNGSLSSGQAADGYEDRNDRSGTNYNTQFVTNDISDAVPDGQPAELKIKMWYFPGAGQSADLDVYVDVPGTETEFSATDCDAFSWKICVEERVVNTVGKSGETTEVGVQMANGRAMQEMPYQMKVDVSYAKDVITPGQAYAFDVPQNATGIVVESAKAGGGEHVRTDFLVIGPDDNLVEYVEYDDIAIPTESKLIPVDQAGEHVLYPIEMTGGFLSVEANTPVPQEQRSARVLELSKERVTDGSSPTPGTGETCVPSATSTGCEAETAWNGGSSASFSVDGAFPLEIRSWINEEGSQNANLDAEIKVQSSEGLVHRSKKIVQYEDERGTIGSSRDELTTVSGWGNLTKGEYTVDYVIDGTASVGHTVTTYQR
jgi:hypothetical protein